VNTAIIGSNGVLNRVAEDGVMPDWFLRPHRRYGTTYRLLYLIVGLQLFTIIVSRGNMYVLGEAYAFGVVWSFVFKAASMVVLRFKDRNPREYKVPFNIRIRGVEVPIGLTLIFLVLLVTAVLNFLTKEVATVAGMVFTAAFLITFMTSEYYHERRRGAAAHKHLEQFNQLTAETLSPATLGLAKPYRKLVAIRSTQNLFMLEQALAETDPDTTDVVVMTAHVKPQGDMSAIPDVLDAYDRELMTAVVGRAEKAGKQVKPVIIPTNNPLYAVIQTAHDLGAQEMIMGASNKYTADEQIEQIAFYWIDVHGGRPTPLTVRILSRRRDVYFDLAGGNRIPKISERLARSVAELRAAGVGIGRVLLVHFDTAESSDLFRGVLTMLDPQVVLTIVPITPQRRAPEQCPWVQLNLQRAAQLRRPVELELLETDAPTAEIVALARKNRYDLVVIGMPDEEATGMPPLIDVKAIVRDAPCRVCLVSSPGIPQETDEAAEVAGGG
jgi:nucleotide-binding universal stress UspA family protein